MVRAWRPDVPGIAEVLHARFTDHAYPMHTHDTWTVIVVDDGAITYDLGRRQHAADRPVVTVLPPHVPHDGRSARAGGFRKRVLYLNGDMMAERLIGPAVDHPELPDPALVHGLRALHAVLDGPGDEFEAQSRLDVVTHRIGAALRRRPAPPTRPDPPLARRLREYLDDRLTAAIVLSDAGRDLGAHPGHLIRAFSRAYGMPPHRYLVGRRIDLARRLLWDGAGTAEAAARAGFYDQAHLTRHWRRTLGSTPAAFVRSGSGHNRPSELPPALS